MAQVDPQLIRLLEEGKRMRASDLHIAVASKPIVRVHNEMMRMENEPKLMPPDTQRLLFSVMNEEQQRQLMENGEVDLAFGLPDIGRYRINIYRQRGSYAGAIRLMQESVPKAEVLGLPESIVNLYNKKSGLVLVTGPTGSGKSTTLAALIQKINENRCVHVLTLEDPIEYLYRHDKALVDQREIGLDSRSFATALRAALREDPDVILVGEMRDLETISTAITAAETGHLVFSTLHTTSAAATINRIIDVFPEGQKEQIRTQLAMVMESVISQRLIPKKDGTGSTACFEIMHCNAAIRNLIRENKTHQINSTIQTNRKLGMITMDDALAEAVQKGLISENYAREYANDQAAVLRKLHNEPEQAPSAAPASNEKDTEKPRYRW